MSYARIIGTGGYLPENVITNADMEKLVDTSDQWIQERTGIEQRHIAVKGETTVDLAEKASRLAIEAAGLKPQDIDLIVFATSTPDKIFPSSACILQARLDIHGCPAFDIQAVCTGFVYALTVAEKFIISGSNKRALVVGAEVFSRILNWKDRSTCVLFGDGAGAVVLEANEKKPEFYRPIFTQMENTKIYSGYRTVFQMALMKLKLAKALSKCVAMKCSKWR